MNKHQIISNNIELVKYYVALKHMPNNFTDRKLFFNCISSVDFEIKNFNNLFLAITYHNTTEKYNVIIDNIKDVIDYIRQKNNKRILKNILSDKNTNDKLTQRKFTNLVINYSANGHIQYLKRIIEHHPEFTSCVSMDNTLMHSIKNGHYETSCYLIDKFKFHLNDSYIRYMISGKQASNFDYIFNSLLNFYHKNAIHCFREFKATDEFISYIIDKLIHRFVYFSPDPVGRINQMIEYISERNLINGNVYDRIINIAGSDIKGYVLSEKRQMVINTMLRNKKITGIIG